MKKLFATMLALVLVLAATAPALATFEDYWDFEEGDGIYSYAFPRFKISMNQYWYQRTRVVVGKGGATVSFYHKASYEAYTSEGDVGGLLFTIGASVNTDFQNLPDFVYLGYDDEECLNYYASFPADYQAYAGNKTIRAEYDALSEGVMDVIASAQIAGKPVNVKSSGSGLSEISCPELGFTTMADSSYPWKYKEGDGVYIYTQEEGYIPYVLVWQSEDLIADPFDYIHEQWTPYMKKQYGDDFIGSVEFEAYEIGGKQLPAGMYTYKLQGHKVKMLRLYDSTGSSTVVYTAKYLVDEDEPTLTALDTAICNFRSTK